MLCASVDPEAKIETETETGASVAPATVSPLDASDVAVSATTSLTSAIGTSGNFVNDDINGLLSGNAWTTTTVTYSFPTDASFYGSTYSDPAAANGFQPLSVAQQAVARYALGLIGQYTQLSFVERTESATVHAQIRIAGSAYPSTSYGYYPSFFSTGGDVWLGNIRNTVPTKSGYAFSTMLHEIGHAVGLKHGHEASGSYGVLPTDHNSTEWSVMTYMSYIGGNTFYNNAEGSGNQTYMIDDIAALQYMYGANFTTNATNTTYTWSTTTGEMFINGVGQGAATTNTAYAAIWDGNGTDTYDLSNYATNLTLDLRPGEWSIFSTAQLANLGGGNLAHGNVANAHMYLNSDTRSLIENANGGSGNDTLRGNQGNNALRGNGGNDIIIGGAGTDVAHFAGNRASYSISYVSGTTFTVAGPDGIDTVSEVESFQFEDSGVAIACFLPGTRIGTPDGARPVEALRIGDPVTVRHGPPRPVKWIGRRAYSADTVADNPQLRPVRIHAGALGPGLPRRDLVLSPQHAVWVAGAMGPRGLLVPAAALVNGASITHEPAGAVQYLHIELQDHRLILAEGLPVESFVDANSRAMFDNAAEYAALYTDEAEAPAPMPRTEEGFMLDVARRRIDARAGLMTPDTVPGPLHGLVERVAGGMLEGWVMDSANPGQPVELHLLGDGAPRRILANRYRGDLHRAGIGTARHGFRVPVAATNRLRLVRATDGAPLPWVA